MPLIKHPLISWNSSSLASKHPLFCYKVVWRQHKRLKGTQTCSFFVGSSKLMLTSFFSLLSRYGLIVSRRTLAHLYAVSTCQSNKSVLWSHHCSLASRGCTLWQQTHILMWEGSPCKGSIQVKAREVLQPASGFSRRESQRKKPTNNSKSQVPI